MYKDITLGKEYDEATIAALKQVLAEEGAQKVDGEYGVGGSQELHTWTYKIGGELLEVTSETYIGLSISGEDELVSRIAEAVKLRLATQE